MDRLSCLVALGVALTALNGCRIESDFTIHSRQDSPSSQGSAVSGSSDGALSYEAETASFDSPIALATSARAFGSKYLVSSVANSGSIEFHVQLPESGDYVIWARVLAPNSSSDSYFVSADSGSEDIYDIAEGSWSSQFQYTEVNGRGADGAPLEINPRLFHLAAGPHVIRFRAREMGAGLDRILLTRDLSYRPDGASVSSPSPTPTATSTPAPNPSPSSSPAPLPTNASGNSFYVSATGTPQGNGSLANPWDLQTALNQSSVVKPGDTIWVRGGAYAGCFSSNLSGTNQAPIIVRQYPSERATIDGANCNTSYLRVGGSYTWIWGLEVTSTSFIAERSDAVTLAGPYNKAINLIVHDAGADGITCFEQTPGGEVYGNLLYYNGRQQYDSAHGHGIYFQNWNDYPGYPGTSKFITDNVIWHNYGFGIHGYAQAGHLDNFDIEGNILFNQGGVDALVGGTAQVNHLKFDHNYVYGDSEIGYSWGPVNSDGTVTNNLFYGHTSVMYWDQFTFTGNLVGVFETDYDSMLFRLQAGASIGSLGFHWDSNAYLAKAGIPYSFVFQEGSQDSLAFSKGETLSQWRVDTGFDEHSTFSTVRPNTQILVRPNKYEPGRAAIAIFNWNMNDSVTVSLAQAGLKIGQAYKIVDAENFYGPIIVSGVYDGSDVTLPMNLTAISPHQNASVAMPTSNCVAYYGNVSNLSSLCPKVSPEPTHSGKEFEAFIVLPQ